MPSFETGQTSVRRDVHRNGRVWSEQALRVIVDSGEALLTACPPGAEARWPTLYAKAHADGDRTARMDAFDAMATGVWDLMPAIWQETELLLWKPSAAWFSVNAFYTPAGLWNWYVNFERPTSRTPDGFDRRNVALPQGSLYLLSGEVRREWEHSIAPMDVTRRSITFRTLG